MKVRIICDNRAMEGYQADWGFACLVEAEENVLFDTGAKPSVLQHNMAASNVDPGSVDNIVLSHDHEDHTGGLPYMSSSNTKAEVIVLPSFGRLVRQQAAPLAVREITAAGEISPGIHSTGPVQGPMPEQAIALNTDQGVVIITGCAHPGVDVLMEAVSDLGAVHAVLGGFHGFSNFSALEGIPFLAPCHCTQHTQEIADRFPESYVEIMAGTELEF